MMATFAKSIMAQIITVMVAAGFHVIAVFFTILRKNDVMCREGWSNRGWQCQYYNRVRYSRCNQGCPH
ncbi:hypothetical protein THS27_18085 [Thalassospira sp. MCCC 1A01428]|nr:hypothetical protein THS27_18085 [Thalassospira sp. MCCC 1A01428]